MPPVSNLRSNKLACVWLKMEGREGKKERIKEGKKEYLAPWKILRIVAVFIENSPQFLVMPNRPSAALKGLSKTESG